MSEPRQPMAAGTTAPEPPREPAASTVAGLSCPSCGGALAVQPGLRVVACPYCETPLLAVSEIGIRRWAVEPTIDAERARARARDWLSRGWNRDRRLRKEAEVGEALLCFVPFYRMEADCIAIVLGTEERRRSVGSGKHRRTQTYEVDVERTELRACDRTYPGLNVAEWGVQKVDLRGDRLIPFERRTFERLGMVFPPTESEAELRIASLEQFKQETDPSAGLKKVRFKFLETLRERLSVVYYPLWVVRFRFAGRSYQILVDAEDGNVAYAKAPGNDLYRAMMLVGTQAAALFVATTILQWAASLEVLGVVGVATLGVLLWGWRRFRHGGVVVEGTGVAPHSGLGGWLRAAGSRRQRDRMLQDLMQGRLPGELP